MATERKHIFVAMGPDIYDYIAKMSGYSGKSMSRYVGELIDADRKKNMDLYEKLVSFGFKGTDPEAERAAQKGDRER